MRPLDIVSCPLDGVHVIEASAGTGKTHAITGLYLRLILEKRMTTDSILVVTFTVAATEELTGRIRERLGEAYRILGRGAEPDGRDALMVEIARRYRNNEGALLSLAEAYRALDQAGIYTIHGFCSLMLGENAFESGSLFSTALAADPDRLLREIAADYWRSVFCALPPAVARQALRHVGGPEDLYRLARRRPVDPGAVIVPDAPAPALARLEKALADAAAALALMRDEWRESRAAVSDLLMTDEGLNRTKYSLKYLSAWLRSLEGYLDADDPMAVFDKLEKFSVSALADAVKKGADAPDHALFHLCETLVACRAEVDGLLQDFILHHKRALLEYARREIGVRRHANNERGFDDLLLDMHRAVCGPSAALAGAIRSRFRVALVDEFQDTDQVQYEIFRAVFDAPGQALFLIGDPKQSIYAFRGADVFSFMRAVRERGGGDRGYTLLENWRSDPDLVEAVNVIFSRKARPFVLDDIAFNPSTVADNPRREALTLDGEKGPALVIWRLDGSLADMKNGSVSRGRALPVIGAAVAGEIVKLLGGDGVRARIGGRALGPGDIAVLVETNQHARMMRERLRAAGVPGVVYGAESVFSSREAVELARVMAAMAEPGREAVLRAALSTDIAGVSGNEIARLTDDQALWERHASAFQRCQREWTHHGFYRAFRGFMDAAKVRQRLLGREDGERRLTNIMHLAEIMHRAEREERLGPEGLVAFLAELIADPDDRDEHQIRLETDDEAVKIITVHRSKGLEFPVVFCPFLWRAAAVKAGEPLTYRDPESGFRLAFDVGTGDDRARAIASREALSEGLRLFYVALTRAKYRCYFAWGLINGCETAAPSYLLFAPDDVAGDDVVQRLADAARTFSPASIRSRLEEIAARSPRAIGVETIGDAVSGRHRTPPVPGEPLAARVFSGPIRVDWAVTSFSSLAADRSASHEGPDHDDGDFLLQARAATKPGDDIASFPRGSRPGQCLHEIFERCDFTAVASADVVVVDALSRYGYDPAWRPALVNMLRRVLAAPFETGAASFTLAGISMGDRLSELEFYFPLSRIEAPELNAIFRRHRVAGFGPDEAGLRYDFGFAPVSGFIRGFVDLVVRHDDRFYIVDWKSNWLGERPADYAAAALSRDMARHRYGLQYHLYAVALHRYLSRTLRGYDYERNFGGVRYVYVRGVDPVAAPGCGIFADRPTRGLIDELASYLVVRERGDGAGE